MLSGRVDARQQGTTVVAPLPHAEYRGHFTPDGKLNIIESQPMIGVVRVEESLWLSSGYHRAYAAMCAQNTPILGVVVTHPAVPDVVLSNRAPRLSDYLKTSLAMPAKMWRVRYELHADLKTRTSQVRRLRPSN